MWADQIERENSEEDWTAWMISSTEGVESHLVHHVKESNSKVMIVSDGSFHPDYQLGTASWIITSVESWRHPMFGSNITPGPNNMQCSHRSEVGGLIGALRH